MGAALIGTLVSACGASDGEAVGSGDTATGAGTQGLTAGLIAAYSFDEGALTTAADASGNANTATLKNGAGWATGHSGSAAFFDGSNDYVDAGNITALNGLTAITVSAWVKGAVGAASPDAVIVAKDTVFALVVDSHKAAFGIKSGNSWLGFPSSTTSVDDGNFHFLTGVYDGTNTRIYVDGVLQGSSNIGARTMNTTTWPVQIASCLGGPNCGGSGEDWAGLVDDVRIYNRALTLAEIQADQTTPVSPPESVPPSTPTDVTGTAVSASQINLTWTASTDNVGVTGYRVFRNGTLVGSPTTTSFSNTGLSASTTYTYTVSALDAAGNVSSLSAPATATTLAALDTAAPSVPTGLGGTAISTTQINLTWTPSTDNVGVTGYRVFRNGTLVGTPNVASFSDTGLNASTIYTYTVRAFDAAANVSAASSSVSISTLAPPDTTPPSVPTNLAGTVVSPNQINLTWTASTDNVGVTGYRVFRDGTLVATRTTTSFSDTGLSPSTSYTYTVAAIDAAANASAESSPISRTTSAVPDTTPPSVPANLAGVAVSPTRIDLTWDASTDNVAVTGYRVFRNSALIATATTNSFSDTGVNQLTTYTYTVAAIDAASNASAASSPVTVGTPAAPDTTPPSVPTGVAGVATSTTTITVTWNASTDNVGVTGYQVFRNGTLVGTTGTPSFADSGLTAATAYAYAVAAMDAALNLSAASSPVSVTTQAPPDTTPPSVPSNLAGTASSATQVNLTWTASTDNVAVTGYRIYRNGTQVGTSSTPAFSDSGLTAATDYTYTVAAVDAAANLSAQSAPVTVTTQAPPAETLLASDNFNRADGPLGPPNWTVIDSNPVIVNQQMREVFSSDGNDSIPIYTAITWPADQYSQIKVKSATEHSGCAAIVRAKNDPVIEMYFVYVTGPLGPNTRLTLAKFVTHNYTELWTQVLPVNVNDTLYLSVRGTTLTVKLNGNVLATREDGSITAAGYAGFDVTDYDGRGSPGDGSLDDWEAGTFGTVSGIGAPTNVAGTPISSSQIALSWTAPSGPVTAASYKVFRNGTQIAAPTSTTYNDSGLTLGTTYSYSVSAVDSSGNTSPPSSTVPVTTLGDTTPPSVPTNLGGTAVSSSQINLTWTASTDNVGVTGYRVFRNNTLIASPTTPSFSDTGLSPATPYSYTVAARDAAGNASAQSAVVNVITQSSADTTPPSVPANVAGTALSSSQISLTWTASTDNVGVTGYRVFRNGTQVGTPTTAAFTDTGLNASTTYAYTVSARDLAGNTSALTTAVNVTTGGATTPSSLVVAFAFDEGSGLTSQDLSGNGLQCTLVNGPTWSTGHTGSAVNLDGINDYVSAGNIPALSGLTAVTTSAWIKGSVGSSSPDGIIIAKDAAFALVVADGNLLFGVKSGNSWYGFPASSSRVDDGAYHYVTGTYDGTNIRVYVDGTLQATQNIGARTLNTSTVPLDMGSCIGGPNCDGSGELWHGMIDDVRVYSRALTASEIVTDMNTPVQ